MISRHNASVVLRLLGTVSLVAFLVFGNKLQARSPVEAVGLAALSLLFYVLAKQVARTMVE